MCGMLPGAYASARVGGTDDHGCARGVVEDPRGRSLTHLRGMQALMMALSGPMMMSQALNECQGLLSTLARHRADVAFYVWFAPCTDACL
jgi:hypothetical protein